jgi:DNA-directed RNA polymerase subunit M
MRLNRETNQMECKRPDCGHIEPKGKEAKITTRKRIDREIVVTESIEGTLPTVKIICEKCKHNEATWIIRQTRAADEPATRIYQCTKCKHKWREY